LVVAIGMVLWLVPVLVVMAVSSLLVLSISRSFGVMERRFQKSFYRMDSAAMTFDELTDGCQVA
jgi:hypothetical protein